MGKGGMRKRRRGIRKGEKEKGEWEKRYREEEKRR